MPRMPLCRTCVGADEMPIDQGFWTKDKNGATWVVYQQAAPDPVTGAVPWSAMSMEYDVGMVLTAPTRPLVESMVITYASAAKPNGKPPVSTSGYQFKELQGTVSPNLPPVYGPPTSVPPPVVPTPPVAPPAPPAANEPKKDSGSGALPWLVGGGVLLGIFALAGAGPGKKDD